jgi:hypothetical protein
MRSTTIERTIIRINAVSVGGSVTTVVAVK